MLAGKARHGYEKLGHKPGCLCEGCEFEVIAGAEVGDVQAKALLLRQGDYAHEMQLAAEPAAASSPAARPQMRDVLQNLVNAAHRAHQFCREHPQTGNILREAIIQAEEFLK